LLTFQNPSPDARRSSILNRALLFLATPAPASPAATSRTGANAAAAELSWSELRDSLADATKTAVGVLGDVVFARRRFASEPKEGVCDAHKACWSGCKVNKGGVDLGTWSAAQLNACILPPDALLFDMPHELTHEVPEGTAVYKGPQRRQTRAPAPEIVFGTIVLNVRLNYRSTQDVLFLQEPLTQDGCEGACPSQFEASISNGTLADAMGQYGFCSNGCQVQLVSVDFKSMREDEAEEGSKSSGGLDEMKMIMLVLGCIFGVLFCLGLVLAYRWHKAVQVRQSLDMYKMEDLSAAAERGRKENIRRALPSAFKPPEGFDINTVASGSRRGSSYKGTSVTGSARQKVLDDTQSVRTADEGKSTHSMGSSRKSTSKRILTNLDRDTIYRQAFPDKFDQVPQDTVFEADDRLADESDSAARSGESLAGGSVAGASRVGGRGSVRGSSAGGSVRGSLRSQGSSAGSDRFGSRLTPGPAGHGLSLSLPPPSSPSPPFPSPTLSLFPIPGLRAGTAATQPSPDTFFLFSFFFTLQVPQPHTAQGRHGSCTTIP